MSSNPLASASNQNRLYTRFITILKILQLIGYFLVALISFLLTLDLMFSSPVPPYNAADYGWAFLVTLILIFIGCSIIYISTQGIIAIIDLLSRIERNTRSQE